MTDDPWKHIDARVINDAINGRRVDAKLPWNLFWAIDPAKHCLLVFRHRAESRPGTRMPKPRGLEITISTPDQSGACMLILKLLDSAQREIFHRLCVDIVEAVGRAKTEADAVNYFVARTWRWHHLLRGGNDGRLSGEEQKGLIGELLALERILLPCLAPSAAVAAWTGPLGTPKDFEVGRICIEAKARRGTAIPFVAISSEHQLDTAGTDALFLYVVEVNSSPVDSPESFTITDIAQRLQNYFSRMDPFASEQFETLLMSAGFDWADDYSDCCWILGSDYVFEVRNDFPRITPRNFLAGVTSVKYAVSLKECETFRVADDAVRLRLKEANNGNHTG